MSSTEAKRQALLARYPGPAWKEKVKKMTDSQVVAVYLRIQQGKK